ncbi:MAG TPA: phenylalanine--tRNA ligase subunit beta, partial [Candidatus Sumerlaeota bacterium]|nr:phenylalanine--tRNA ligase subunit beta [Candidatus Sumerlaeota bacterium]
VSQDVPADQIERTIRTNAGDYLESLFLFDCYQGKQVPDGMKSLAFRAVYRHPERTLKEEEVNEAHYRILEAIGLEYGASLRDS